MSDRLGIVLLGATGFTGRLVAEYLFTHAPQSLTFGVAGRSKEKLEAVVADVRARAATGSGAASRDVPIIVADSNNESELRAMVKRARVVCTTVGPYAKYGRTLARVCAEEGVHYTDLTGEVTFMRQSIEDNDAAAKKSHARIVHACGFDSIPSDLGTFLLYRRAEEMGLTMGPTTLLVRKADGGFSGGTVASMLELTDAAKKDPKVRALVADPHALELTPPPSKDRRDRFNVTFDRDLSAWTAPFIMAMCNTRVVRRTNALLGYAYGPEFRYREVMSFPKGPRGAAMAYGVLAGLGAFTAAISTPLRGLVESRLPKPGEGPSEETRNKGSFKLDILCDTRNKAREPGPKLGVRIVGEGDPGYAATARMLGEASMCLAEDALPERYGVLTPASAMGDFLAARLGGAGVTFTVSVRE
jgi:short subunit dehydrogenase-like uncharacterized protein